MDTQALPSWMVPAPMERGELARLKRENEQACYESLFERVLDEMYSGSTLTAAIREQAGQEINEGRFRRWIQADDNRYKRFKDAKAMRTHVWADRAIQHATMADALEDVSRSSCVISTYKWLMACDNRKEYGDVRQVDQTIVVNMVDAITEARERANAALTVDVTARVVE